MNTKTLVAAAIAFSMSGTALAEGPYIGAKVGIMDADDVGGASFDSATNGGILVGYDFGSGDMGMAIEAEFTTTVSDGDISYLGASGDWDVDTFAVYGALRYGQDFYFKAKLGYLNEDVSISGAGGSVSGDDSGLSVGLGGGYKFSDTMAIEAEWTLIEEDIDFLSLGVNFSF